jgi:hypothetical protein
MKLTGTRLRKIIKEELVRGIPEFSVRQIAETCSEDVKRLIVSHINSNSSSQQERIHMISQMNIIIEDLEKEVKDLIESKLSEFSGKSRR